MGFGTKLAAGVDAFLHTTGVLVVLAVFFDYLDMSAPWVIGWIVVALIGLPYPGLHEVWENDE